RSRRPAVGESGSLPFGPCLSGGNSGKLSTPQRLSSRAQRPAAALVCRHRTHRQKSAILTGGPEGRREQTAKHFMPILRRDIDECWISGVEEQRRAGGRPGNSPITGRRDYDEGHFGIRSEEHTSELQSRFDLVCR